MTAISVIIPSYNHPDKIRQCVDSILRQDFTGGFEVVVVDSSPRQTQLEVERRLSELDNLTLIKLQRQTFPGTARNVGVESSGGETIAFIDADCIAEDHWLHAIASHIAPGKMLAGVIENGTEEDVMGTCSYLVEFNEFLPFEGRERPIVAAPTCNLAVSRRDFVRTGGFTDDRAFEDFLFCRKFTEGGGRIVQLSDLRIRHMNKTAITDVARNQRLLGEYSARVRKRHGLPPRFLFRLPELAFGLPLYRYARILGRVRKTNYLKRFLSYTPIVIYLLAQWSLGFYAGARGSHPSPTNNH